MVKPVFCPLQVKQDTISPRLTHALLGKDIRTAKITSPINSQHHF